MHHLICGISSLLHSVNLIVFTLLLVHLILCISPHHSHHLSLPRSAFYSRLKTQKLICATILFLHDSLSGSLFGLPSRIWDLDRT